MSDKREELAAYAHDAWSGWMDYLFSKCVTNEGIVGIVMPLDCVDRWKRQAATPYADLPEEEKASDRDEADKMLAIVKPNRAERG